MLVSKGSTMNCLVLTTTNGGSSGQRRATLNREALASVLYVRVDTAKSFNSDAFPTRVWHLRQRAHIRHQTDVHLLNADPDVGGDRASCRLHTTRQVGTLTLRHARLLSPIERCAPVR